VAKTTSARPSSACLAYEHIAPFYDAFTAHHDYEGWTRRLLVAARAHGLRGRRLLDVGCGTGKSFLPLLSRGWEVTGCDVSPSMLRRARAKTQGSVRLELADVRSLPKFGSFDLVWCLDDVLNYVLGTGELERSLRGLRRNLAAGGLVLFDLNTLRAFRAYFAETHVHELGPRRLVWRGHAAPDAPPGTEISASFEVVPAGGRGEPAARTSLHRQRHFRPEAVLSAIERAGLSCLAVFGHGLDGHLQQPLDEDVHTKAIFIARST
jgi:SAM-dependent methyltransferase